MMSDVAQPKSSTSKAALGAAAAGAVLGTILIGPITGIVVAGAALYASTRDDSIGEAARGTGHATVTAYERTMEAAEKYQVKEKVTAATSATYHKMQEINEEYKVTEKVQAATADVVRSAQDLDRKYDISGKTNRALAAGATAAVNSFARLTARSESDAKPAASALPPPK